MIPFIGTCVKHAAQCKHSAHTLTGHRCFTHFSLQALNYSSSIELFWVT